MSLKTFQFKNKTKHEETDSFGVGLFFSVKRFKFVVRFFKQWKQEMFWFHVYGNSNALFVYGVGKPKLACLFWWNKNSYFQQQSLNDVLPSKICGRQPLKILLGPFLNTLSHFFYAFTLLSMITFWFVTLKSTTCDLKENVQFRH